MNASATALTGKVERTFRSDDVFSAGKIRRADGKLVGFKAFFRVADGEDVTLYGKWTTHPTYGDQFSAASRAEGPPPTTDGTVEYLAKNPQFKGFGRKKAKALVNMFGAELEGLAEADTAKLARSLGVAAGMVEVVQQEWARGREVNAALAWLAGLGLTHRQTKTIVDKYAENARAVLQEDPYILAREVDGFGFKRADEVAAKLGIRGDHPSRLRAGVIYVAEEHTSKSGDCYLTEGEMLQGARPILAALGVDDAKLAQAIEDAVGEGRLRRAEVGGQRVLGLRHLHDRERELAAWFSRGTPNPHFAKHDDAALDVLADEVAADLNEGQRVAFLRALRDQQIVLTGGAGSGKTFSIAAIVRACEKAKLSVALCAPTGKAARRVQNAVDRPASTIHRMLQLRDDNTKVDAEKPQAEAGKSNTEGGKFLVDVLVVDESSMVDVNLAWRLYKRLDLEKTAVVLVGDHNQLPPVGPGAVLRDLVLRKPIPVVHLDHIVRQAGSLKENCSAILRGEVRPSEPVGADGRSPWVVNGSLHGAMDVRRELFRLLEDDLQDRLGFDLLQDVQVLAPMKKGPIGTIELNADLQMLFQRKLHGRDIPRQDTARRPTLYKGDRVIQTRNNYKLGNLGGVMNGSVGVVESVNADPKKPWPVVVGFDDEVVTYKEPEQLADLQLAYALTVHKCQGSEFPCVVAIIHQEHAYMHTRNLLYTAATRAAKSLYVLGDGPAIQACAMRTEPTRRRTFLSVFPMGAGAV